jgi:hypothetical protein
MKPEENLIAMPHCPNCRDKVVFLFGLVEYVGIGGVVRRHEESCESLWKGMQ